MLKIGTRVIINNPDKDLNFLKGEKAVIIGNSSHKDYSRYDIKLLDKTLEKEERIYELIRPHEITHITRKAKVYRRTG